MKFISHLNLVPTFKMNGTMPPLPHYAFMPLTEACVLTTPLIIIWFIKSVSSYYLHNLRLEGGLNLSLLWKKKVKVKWSRCRPGVAQRVGRGIALLFHDRGTRRGEWSEARPGRTLPPEDPVPILQEAEWAPGPVWTEGKSSPQGFDPGPSNP